MHNKLAGTKEFGRTIRIHNTPLPPRPHTRAHFHIHSHVLTRHLQTSKHAHKANKNNSNMDSLINTTCFHKVTEFANNWKLPCHLTVNWEG